MRITSGTRCEAGEFSSDGFAKDQRTSIFESGNTLGFIALKFIRWQATTCLRAETIHMKNIFNTDGHSKKPWAILGIRKTRDDFLGIFAQSLEALLFGDEGEDGRFTLIKERLETGDKILNRDLVVTKRRI